MVGHTLSKPGRKARLGYVGKRMGTGLERGLRLVNLVMLDLRSLYPYSV